ncbi:MAG: type II toxin-antitoxin system RelE/ParE family toxin [Thermomicrobiales bacterium]
MPSDNKYANTETADFAAGLTVAKFHSVPARTAFKKLDQIEAATSLGDLRAPASNRFHSLSGDRNGQYSISINMKWRIAFEWSSEHNSAFNIEIVDYH